jgi:hypothetical protein
MSGPSFLFQADMASYFDTPDGCIRFVRREGDYIVGVRFGQKYKVHYSDAVNVKSRKLREEKKRDRTD